MTTPAPGDLKARLHNLIEVSECTTDADTNDDATFVAVTIEDFLATMRDTIAALSAPPAASEIAFLIADWNKAAKDLRGDGCYLCCAGTYEHCAAHLAAIDNTPAPVAASGTDMVTVPKEPTPEMVAAAISARDARIQRRAADRGGQFIIGAHDAGETMADTYRAMIAAAPLSAAASGGEARAAAAALIAERDAYKHALHLIADGDRRPGHVDALTQTRMAEIAFETLAHAAVARAPGGAA